ncbi:hypothetical protein [Neobacillus cucumis]|uniref:DUF2500 domain-containing protein n=1 Tax=Neobacillus cucumis TaxID=1740721 RepID=A0A2N5HLM4_9BACI|nr:hypothetical protein [Neobacillus cucumis]PLS06429.1 hypothetical protein CVD27_07755 [Neobacillus cucumis]
MVTAIVVPIICLYFFWLTRKERKEQERKWLEVGEVRQEAVVSGEIKGIVEETQKFYYHRYIYVQTIKLQTSTKVINAIKRTPLTQDRKKDTFTIGETIHLYGSWEGNNFLFNQWVNEKR